MLVISLGDGRVPPSMVLTESQQKTALELLSRYKASGFTIVHQGIKYSSYRDFDKTRIQAISEIKTLLHEFLHKKIDLEAFKDRNSLLSIKHNYWGFTGFSGQMTLNQLANWSKASQGMTQLLIESLPIPSNKEQAKQRIRRFNESIPRLVPADKPLRLGATPFFLSYFWQIENPETIPIYYPASKNALLKWGLMEPEKDFADSYVSLWDLHDALSELYKSATDISLDNRYWFVEHVLWASSYNEEISEPARAKKIKTRTANESIQSSNFLDFVPPKLQDLNELAQGGDSNIFENKVGLAFQMLGFKVDLLGQGSGRNPDGIAYCREHNFAVLFDAKAHKEGYGIGRDDRTAIEYIRSHERSLRRDGYSNIFFVFISGSFRGGFKPNIDRIRKETTVKSVVLLTSDNLLRLLARNIENPLAFELEQFQTLLLDSGELSVERLEAFWGE